MSWLAKIMGRKSFSVSMAKDHSRFLYREGGRSVSVEGETMAGGFSLYASSIEFWDGASRDPISEPERLRIAGNILSYYAARGKNVYLA